MKTILLFLLIQIQVLRSRRDFETIGIESDIFETKATYIDSSLLEKRHKVVHGERSDLDKEDFLTTFKIIIDLS